MTITTLTSVVHKHVFINGFAFTDLFYTHEGERYQSRVLGTLGYYEIGQQLALFAERKRVSQLQRPRIIPQ